MLGAIIAGAASAGSSILGGRSSKKASRAQAKEYERQAVDRGKTARYDQWRRNLAQRKAVGSQIATYANLGLELEGTPIENLAETVKELTIERQLDMQTARSEITGLYAAAKGAKAVGNASMQAGLIGGIASGIGTYASLSSPTGKAVKK